MANVLNTLYACFHWSFNGKLKSARQPWVQGIWHPCVGCACFSVSFQDGTDINCLIWKRQELGTIMLNSKVSLIFTFMGPSMMLPTGLSGLESTAWSFSSIWGMWGWHWDHRTNLIKYMWSTWRVKMFKISLDPPQTLGGPKCQTQPGTNTCRQSS